MSHWKHYNGKLSDLLDKYSSWLHPADCNLSFLLHLYQFSNYIFVNEFRQCIGVVDSDKRFCLYGSHQRIASLPGKWDFKEVIGGAYQDREGEVIAEFSILNLINWRDQINQRLKRQIKETKDDHRGLLFHAHASSEEKETLLLIQRLMKLYHLDPRQISFIGQQDNLAPFIKVGTFSIRNQEVEFIMTIIGKTMTANFHFDKRPVSGLDFNITTAFHETMIEQATKLGLDYYSLGVTQAQGLGSYESVRAYKNQWGGDLHQLKRYEA